MGRDPKNQPAVKVRRFKSAAELTRLELVVYELLSLLEETVGDSPSERRVRLRSLKARIAPGMITASATEVEQFLAEDDGDDVHG